MQLYDRIRAYGYEWPRFLTEYGALEKNADDCSDCGQCEEKCPYNLPIRERLGHIRKRYAGLKQFGET
jgi:predicted aldo/keto reductase-like oxidoreductase